MNYKIKKTLSVLVAVCFLLSTAGTQASAVISDNARAGLQYKQIFGDFSIPYSYGKITDAHFASTDRVIINIQDLHCHAKVQKNISNIIDLFDKKYGVKTVYLEGAYGDVDTSWMLKTSNPAVANAIFEKMIETGRLTGAEYYSAVSGRTGIIKGLEKKEPYIDNLRRFGQMLENKEKIELILQSVNKSAQDLKNKYYDRRQFKLEQLSKDYADGKISSEKYYALLSKHIEKLGIDIYKYENTLNYISLLEFQSGLKYTEITKELQSLVLLLKGQLPFNAYKMLLDSTNNFAHVDKLYGYLIKITKQYNLDLSVNYPELNKYFSYIELSQKINPLCLITEERELINEINTRFSSTKSQRDVVFMCEFSKYLENYLTSKITKEDYEYYSANIGKYRQLWNKYADNRVLYMLDGYIAQADRFYKINTDRNEYFTHNLTQGINVGKIEPETKSDSDVNNILNNMKGVKRVDVVITGGFHTKSVSDILNNQKISYIVITPNVTDGTKYAEQTYYRIAKEQSKISFQTLANLAPSLSIEAQIKIWNMVDPESLRSSDLYKQNPQLVEKALGQESILSQEQLNDIKELIGYSSILESDDSGNVSEQIINLIKDNLGKNNILTSQVDEDLLKYVDIEKLKEAVETFNGLEQIIKNALQVKGLQNDTMIKQSFAIIQELKTGIMHAVEARKTGYLTMTRLSQRLDKKGITGQKRADIINKRENIWIVLGVIFPKTIGKIFAYLHLTKEEKTDKIKKEVKITSVQSAMKAVTEEVGLIIPTGNFIKRLIKGIIFYRSNKDLLALVHTAWNKVQISKGNKDLLLQTDKSGGFISKLKSWIFKSNNSDVIDVIEVESKDGDTRLILIEMADGNNYAVEVENNGRYQNMHIRNKNDSAIEKTLKNVVESKDIEKLSGVKIQIKENGEWKDITSRASAYYADGLRVIRGKDNKKAVAVTVVKPYDVEYKSEKAEKNIGSVDENLANIKRITNTTQHRVIYIEDFDNDSKTFEQTVKNAIANNELLAIYPLRSAINSEEMTTTQLFNVYNFILHRFHYFSKSISKLLIEEYGWETTITYFTTEILKNAFLHGNKLKTDMPIYINFSGRQIKFYNFADSKSQMSTREKFVFAATGGSGFKKGVKFMSGNKFKSQEEKEDVQMQISFSGSNDNIELLDYSSNPEVKDNGKTFYEAVIHINSSQPLLNAGKKININNVEEMNMSEVKQQLLLFMTIVMNLPIGIRKKIADINTTSEQERKLLIEVLKAEYNKMSAPSRSEFDVRYKPALAISKVERGTDKDFEQIGMDKTAFIIRIIKSGIYEDYSYFRNVIWGLEKLYKNRDLSQIDLNLLEEKLTGYKNSKQKELIGYLKSKDADLCKYIEKLISERETQTDRFYFQELSKSATAADKNKIIDGYANSLLNEVDTSIWMMKNTDIVKNISADNKYVEKYLSRVEGSLLQDVKSGEIGSNQSEPVMSASTVLTDKETKQKMFLKSKMKGIILKDMFGQREVNGDYFVTFSAIIDKAISVYFESVTQTNLAKVGLGLANISEEIEKQILNTKEGLSAFLSARGYDVKSRKIKTLIDSAVGKTSGTAWTLEEIIKEADKTTSLKVVEQVKRAVNPASTAGTVQEISIKIVAGSKAAERFKEGQTNIKETLVVINDSIKAEELRKEGLNVATAVIVQKEEKTKLKGSEKVGTIGNYNGAVVRAYWNAESKELMFYSKSGLAGADIEQLKQMFANMQTEGIKAEVFKAISQIVVTDKENYDETIKAMENTHTDAQSAVMAVKGIELDLTKRTGKISETVCKNECTASGTTTFVISEQQANDNAKDIAELKGYKFIIKHASIIGAESIIYDGAKIDASAVEEYKQVIKILEGLKSKALAKGGISIKLHEDVYKKLAQEKIDIWQQYGIIPIVGSQSAYIKNGQIGRVEVEDITEQNIDSILNEANVMTIVVDNSEILSSRKDAVKEAKTAKEKQKKEYKASLNANIKYTLNLSDETNIKTEELEAKIREAIGYVADILKEDLTQETTSETREKVKKQIEKIKESAFYNSLNEKARSRIDHLMKDKDAVQKTAAFIRVIAMRTAEEFILSWMRKNGIDIKTEEFREFLDGRFREAILIRAVQLWLSGQNMSELLKTDFIASDTVTAEQYMQAVMDKIENIESNIGSIFIENEYKISSLSDVAAAIAEFKEFNILLQDEFRKIVIDKGVEVSMVAVKSILGAA